MKQKTRWLLDEIAGWQREGIIDADQARQLSARYGAAVGGDWGRLIFTGLGAVIFGLGILLLIAYNWQGLHRFAKLALIGTSLLLAHGLGGWLHRPGSGYRRVGESLHLLGTLLFGGGIWLVAQIYHLDEHYPNAFLIWSLGALGLAWALPSVAQGLLALALLFLWGWFEVFDFRHPNHWAPWLVALGVIPLAWQQRARVLLWFSLGLFLALYAFAVARVNDDLVFSALFLTAGAYLGLARWAPRSAFAESAPVFQSVGGAVYLVLLFIAGFGGFDGGLIEGGPGSPLAWLYWGVPAGLALLGWGAALAAGVREGGLERWASGLILGSLILVAGASLGLTGLARWNWLVFNLVFLVHAGILIALGIRRLRWPWLVLGGLMLAALIFARFLDLFDSLLARAAVFVLLGAGLFLVGLRYSRQKQRLQEVAHG